MSRPRRQGGLFGAGLRVLESGKRDFGKATALPLKKRGITAKFLLTWAWFSSIIYGHAAERTSSAPRDRDEPGDCSKEVTSGEYVR